jgi:tRNA (guanosine-2'-O-)-methyltransferase
MKRSPDQVLPKRLERLKSVAAMRQAGFIVVLEDIHDPHNAEAIFRTCDAFGIQHIYLVFEHEDPFNPKGMGKSSSSSAHKWLNFTKFKSTKECLTKLHADGYTIYGTAFGDDCESLFDAKLDGEKIAIIFGNEHSGLSPVALTECDVRLTLPLFGMVQSLNVSVAAGIFLYEIVRQRKPHLSRYQLPVGIAQLLGEDFLSR